MPSYSGTCMYGEAGGAPAQTGPCRLDFDDETLTLIPGKGAAFSCDLGDIDEFSPAEYELRLKLYTGDNLVLSRFGKSFQDLCHYLQEAYRKRTIQCLLLEDLEEIDRFDGAATLQSPGMNFTAPAEIRLCQSNLAVLPQGQVGLQWRLADIDLVSFDDAQYAVVIRSGEEVLRLTRLAKRTQEFMERLGAALTEIAGRSAATVHSVFPFLTPEQSRRATELLKEGRVASTSQLASIHARTLPALTEKVVSARLKPYYDYLVARTAAEAYYAGFKLIRKEVVADTADGTEEAASQPSDDASAAIPEPPAVPATGVDEDSDTEILYWFIFPLCSREGNGLPKLAAWETTSRSGRATYFFRLDAPEEAGAAERPVNSSAEVDKAVRRLNRGLLLLNFRRSPIYLPDDSLQMQPQYRRYAIASRRLPAVRFLRSSFLGRALHSSPQAWQQQVERILQP
jgi:hypothetical protein